MAGLQGLSKSAQTGLKESLAAQSAPANTQTPLNRTDPAQTTSLDFQRVRHLLTRMKQALELTSNNLQDENDPRLLFINALEEGVTLLLRDKHLPDAADAILERLFPLASPMLKQRVAAMFTPISPPNGLGGGAPGATPNPGAAGGVTGPTPGGAATSAPSGEAGNPPA